MSELQSLSTDGIGPLSICRLPLANDCHCRPTPANASHPNLNLNRAASKNEALSPSMHQEHFLL